MKVYYRYFRNKSLRELAFYAPLLRELVEYVFHQNKLAN